MRDNYCVGNHITNCFVSSLFNTSLLTCNCDLRFHSQKYNLGSRSISGFQVNEALHLSQSHQIAGL